MNYYRYIAFYFEYQITHGEHWHCSHSYSKYVYSYYVKSQLEAYYK